jgi:hypothetical protein
VHASTVHFEEDGKVFLNNPYQPTWKNLGASISQIKTKLVLRLWNTYLRHESSAAYIKG